jgi:hypothetical protein
LKLYKYCPFNTNFLSILINRKIWYGKPSEFNDPFDGEFNVDVNCTLDEFIETFQLDTGKYPREMIEKLYCDQNGLIKQDIVKEHSTIVEVYRNIGVLSLTPHKKKVLMWSHYANEHRGVAIGFRIKEDVPVVKVNYQKSLPEHKLPYFYKLERKDEYILIQYTKHNNWSYENERRLSVSRGNRLCELPGEITEIIFGCKMLEVHKETVANLLNQLSYGQKIKLISANKTDNLSIDFKPYKTRNLTI